MEKIMDCDKVKDFLPMYDDGSLDDDTRTEIENHLVMCSECRREHSEIGRIVLTVRDELNKSSFVFKPNFLEGVQGKIRKVKRSRIFYRALSIAAVIVMTISLALYGFVFRNKLLPYEKSVMNESEMFDDYIASQYLSPYDLGEIVDNGDMLDNSVLMRVVLAYDYQSMTPEDIFELIDEDEVTEFFQQERKVE
jgi:predicted anti-sigma-YlaC factor YlaD